ncbi:STAS domain-containing protein [Cellulophaga baltica]|uniref:STAS domain-containing protein n=1 Tax=Cellulophaga baltica TaxID=76594 RepID=UPI0037C89AAD
MALKILSTKNGTFAVEGEINAATASQFKSHFETNLNTLNVLTVDIDKITEVDATGMRALRSLYKKAFLENKSFSIVGNGCKDIYDDFRASNIA